MQEESCFSILLNFKKYNLWSKKESSSPSYIKSEIGLDCISSSVSSTTCNDQFPLFRSCPITVLHSGIDIIQVRKCDSSDSVWVREKNSPDVPTPIPDLGTWDPVPLWNPRNLATQKYYNTTEVYRLHILWCTFLHSRLFISQACS